MNKFKVGIVGVSRGGSFMRNYARSERTEITALCDLDQSKLASCGASLNLPDSALYTDYDAFLNSDVEIVVVSTPIPFHEEQVVKALNAGKHVLSEVTMANTIEGCRNIYEAAKKAKTKYMLAENYMYFHVMKEGVVVATELVLCSNEYAYSFLGGTNEEYYAMRPNDFLKDAIIKWCNETGRKFFILGGGYHKDDGIYRYKRSFTKLSDVPFFIGRAILNKEVYSRFVELRAAEAPLFDKESSFFPLYRA